MMKMRFIAASLSPWVIVLTLIGVTLAVENSALRGNDYLNWIGRGRTPFYLFIGIGLLWVACRGWIGFHLEWPPFQRIVWMACIAFIELSVAFVVLLYWAVGMIGGPINPG